MKKRQVYPEMVVRARPASSKLNYQAATSNTRASANISFDYLFGQSNLSSAWADGRANIKNLMSGLMASIKPQGTADGAD